MTAPEALFEVDDFEPLTVKRMMCAACLGSGCTRCSEIGRLGSSIWRGAQLLMRIEVSA